MQKKYNKYLIAVIGIIAGGDALSKAYRLATPAIARLHTFDIFYITFAVVQAAIAIWCFMYCFRKEKSEK
jgi:hypothetical protein